MCHFVFAGFLCMSWDDGCGLRDMPSSIGRKVSTFNGGSLSIQPHGGITLTTAEES
jgi:hypothetical protein